jgi:hypothetical protein
MDTSGTYHLLRLQGNRRPSWTPTLPSRTKWRPIWPPHLMRRRQRRRGGRRDSTAPPHSIRHQPRRRKTSSFRQRSSPQLILRGRTSRLHALLGRMALFTTPQAQRGEAALPLHVPCPVTVEADSLHLRRNHLALTCRRISLALHAQPPQSPRRRPWLLPAKTILGPGSARLLRPDPVRRRRSRRLRHLPAPTGGRGDPHAGDMVLSRWTDRGHRLDARSSLPPMLEAWRPGQRGGHAAPAGKEEEGERREGRRRRRRRRWKEALSHSPTYLPCIEVRKDR